MTVRFTLLPDPQFEPLTQALRQRMQQAAAAVTWQNFGALLDPTMQGVLRMAIAVAGADEGTVWLLDGDMQNLIPAYNTGPHAARFVGSFQQPVGKGLISMVVDSQQYLCDNKVHENERRDSTLDEKLGVVTVAMIAVPFDFADQMRGVISCVQLRAPAEERERPAFEPADIDHMNRAARVLGKLIDHHLLGVTTGWLRP
ncbi:MAG TPA: GAF domain-containing protein [Longimicrobiales bacterium]|nr:GAF domain-containing protein [Longimicrobiales bacterium]